MRYLDCICIRPVFLDTTAFLLEYCAPFVSVRSPPLYLAGHPMYLSSRSLGYVQIKNSVRSTPAQRLMGYVEDTRKLEHFLNLSFRLWIKGWSNYSWLLRLASAELKESNSKFNSLINVRNVQKMKGVNCMLYIFIGWIYHIYCFRNGFLIKN